MLYFEDVWLGLLDHSITFLAVCFSDYEGLVYDRCEFVALEMLLELEGGWIEIEDTHDTVLAGYDQFVTEV